MKFNFRSVRSVFDQPELFDFDFIKRIENGQIGKVGTFDPRSIEQLRNVILESENVLSKDKNLEHSMAATPYGNIYHNMGNSGYVDIASVVPEHELKNAFVTHNHAEGIAEESLNFSMHDVREYYTKGLLNLRGVFRDHRYGMQHISNKKVNPNNVIDDYEIARRKAMDYFRNKEKYPDDQELADVLHYILGRQYGYRFWRR